MASGAADPVLENETEVIEIPLLDLGEARLSSSKARMRIHTTFQEDFGIEPKWAVAMLVGFVVMLFGIIIWLSITKLN